MDKPNKYRRLAIVICVGGIVLTIIGWMHVAEQGSLSPLLGFLVPIAAFVGLAFTFFRPSDPSDSRVPQDRVGTTDKPGYPKPSLVVRVLIVLGFVAGVANWYLLSQASQIR